MKYVQIHACTHPSAGAGNLLVLCIGATRDFWGLLGLIGQGMLPLGRLLMRPCVIWSLGSDEGLRAGPLGFARSNSCWVECEKLRVQPHARALGRYCNVDKQVYTCIYISLYVYMYICNVCMYACMYVCMYTYA